MSTIHYRSEDGITGYAEGDILIDDTTGKCTRVVRTGAGLQLEPATTTTTVDGALARAVAGALVEENAEDDRLP